jgi:hypothetical protein
VALTASVINLYLKLTEAEMTIDLTPRWDNFAVYLPAMQFPYASAVASNKMLGEREFPKGINLKDLDFLNPKSKLWHYGYALYSAGQFTDARPKACCVTNRDRASTTVLGDSGGYQIGKGTLKGTEHFKTAKSPDKLCDMWRDSVDVRQRIVRWLDAHSDFAMTIDMPLWAREPQNRNTPFHKCSIEQLIELSIENLDFIKRNSNGSTKWLNVLQGTNQKDSKQWWDAVKGYKMGGWALAGSVGWRGIRGDETRGIKPVSGIETVLTYVMMMRDDNAFTKGQDWLHVLGVSQPTWAVLLTSVQRAIRKHCKNPNLRVSYDSASPFQAGGERQQVVRYPKLTKDISSWVMTAHESPVNPMYAGQEGAKFHFPFSSPLGDLLTLNHLNVRGGEFNSKTLDTIGTHILTNHNVWVYVRAFLEANELMFMHKSEADKAVPQKLMDTCAFIEDLLGENNWQARIKKEKKLLDTVFSKSQKDEIPADALR